MPKINDDGPHFFVCQDALRRRHSGWPKTTFNDPFQLPIFIGLHAVGFQGRHRWGHVIGEGDARILTIETMTGHAVVGKGGLSVLDVLWSFRERIFCGLPANGDSVLDPGRGGRFPLSGWSGPAPGKGESEAKVKQGSVDAHEAGYSTT